MASSGVDPFRAVQEEVSRQMETIQADIAKWQKLPTKSPKYEPTRQRIVSSLSELQVDLQDMQATIDIALKDPAKFALTPSELMTRQTFVRDLQAHANDARDTLDPNAAAAAASGRQRAASRSSLLAGGGSSSSAAEASHCCRSPEPSSWTDSTPTSTKHSSAAFRDNEATLEASQQQQQQQIAEQDQELGVLGGALTRLGHMSKTMGDELRAQGKELDAFNEEVTDAHGRMAQATDAMKKMLKKKDRGKFCAILFLTIVLIVLMYAVISW